MTAIKSRILRIWETAPTSIKICCIKFAQRVVLAQTAATSAEHKVWCREQGWGPNGTGDAYITWIQRGDGLDISLLLVPANHALLDVRNLEAEATGLLDRMLSVLQDNSR